MGACVRALLVFFAVLFACKRPPQGPCPFDLGGTWVNASDERYRYSVDDHGAELSGKLLLPGDPPVTITLRRDGEKLAGTMRSQAASRSGKPCQVDFELRVSSCTPQEIKVVSEMSLPLDDACRRIRDLPDGGAVQPDLAEFVWVRPHR